MSVFGIDFNSEYLSLYFSKLYLYTKVLINYKERKFYKKIFFRFIENQASYYYVYFKSLFYNLLFLWDVNILGGSKKY